MTHDPRVAILSVVCGQYKAHLHKQLEYVVLERTHVQLGSCVSRTFQYFTSGMSL